MPLEPNPWGPQITFAWALGAILFRRLEPGNKGMLLAVEATRGGDKRYQVVFREADGRYTQEWYYSVELDSDES